MLSVYGRCDRVEGKVKRGSIAAAKKRYGGLVRLKDS
jgi:hypothetical protein